MFFEMKEKRQNATAWRLTVTGKPFGLKLYEAAQKLAYDFGITQDKPPDKTMQEKLNRKSEAQRLRENEKLCFSALLEYIEAVQLADVLGFEIVWRKRGDR